MSMGFKQDLFRVKPRAALLGLLCFLLLAGFVACQPKQSAPDNAAASQQGQEAAAQQGEAPVSDKDPLTNPSYAEDLMTTSPEFSEAELVKIYKDMEPVSRGSMSEVVHYLSAEKGWGGSRVYYILSKVSSAEMILQDEANREYLARDWPHDMPTAKELALVQKHRATLHKLIGQKE